MKYEYKEGREASENFDRAMKQIFRAPKQKIAQEVGEKNRRKP